MSCENELLVDNQTADAGFPSDGEIGRSGNIFGIKPTMHNLTLTLTNELTYVGDMEIYFTVSGSTDRLAVHMDKDTVDYNRLRTKIEILDTKDRLAYNCIKTYFYNSATKTLVMAFKSPLSGKYKYRLNMPRFNSSVYNRWTMRGAKGLLRSGDRQIFSALYTNFALRNARTVFPCMDHPALKTEVILCVGHPSKYRAISAARKVAPKLPRTRDRAQTCFAATSSIPIYVFSFALIYGYEQTVSAHNPNVTIHHPSLYRSSLFGNLSRYSSMAIDYMTTVTGKAMPFGPLQLLVLFKTSRLSADNVGLITAKGEEVLDDHADDVFWEGFFRSVAHQWIGGLATVGGWDEICLQQSLAEYFKWILLEKVGRQPLNLTAGASSQLTLSQAYRPHVRLVTQNEYETGLCLIRAPLFCHSLTNHYNVTVMERFLRSLLTNASFNNAPIQSWDEILARNVLSDDKMSTYFQSWFKNPGPITLRISYENSTLRIQQTDGEYVSSVHVVPLTVYDHSMAHPRKLILNKPVCEEPFPDELNWAFVDPNQLTFAKKVYDARIYQLVFTSFYNGNGHTFDKPWKTELMRGFCAALLSNSLLIGDSSEQATWRNVFALANFLNADCFCCVRPVSERGDCENDSNNVQCKDIQLVTAIGYNNQSISTDKTITAF